MSKKKSGVRLKDFIETYDLVEKIDEVKAVLKEWRGKDIAQINQYIEEDDKLFLIEYYELLEPSTVEKKEKSEDVEEKKTVKKHIKTSSKKPVKSQTTPKAPKQEKPQKPIEPKPIKEETPLEETPKIQESVKQEILPQEPQKSAEKIEKQPPKVEEIPKEQKIIEEKKDQKLTSSQSAQIPKQIETRKPKAKETKKELPKEEKKEEIKIIEIPEIMSVRDFAELIGISPNQVIKELFQEGILITINQNIEPDMAVKIAEKFGFLAEIKKTEAPIPEEQEEQEDSSKLKPRPPVVVVMGHVDHGKTTLLDTIRKTNIAAKEKGGITQHIGASMVKTKDGKTITFLDTPGHEAFTSLRARGAKITDIAILVVAADDGVMPQTIEAINHAKAFNVPIVVAVNKIDKPGADPARVRRELSELGVIPEEWGGDTIFVDVSAKTGKGVEDLLEMIMLVAEMMELKANPDKRAKGVIIESRLDKQKGPLASLLITEGTLKTSDIFVVGSTYGRVRAMTDSVGNRLKQATPSMAVEIIGFEEVPEAGDMLRVVNSEKEAKELAQQKKMLKEKEKNKDVGISLGDIFKKIKEGEIKELRLIVKADTIGSLEAIKKSLMDIKTDEVNTRLIHEAIGYITESDVMLAKATKSIILGFNVRPDLKAKEIAEKEKVDIRLYGIIYELLDDVKNAISGMLTPVKKEITTGLAQVRATFKVKGAGTVAGCYVLEGKVSRNQRARIIRNGVVIYDGKIESLKRFKEDVAEVSKGYECGIKLENYNDIKVQDEIEFYEIKEEKQNL